MPCAVIADNNHTTSIPASHLALYFIMASYDVIVVGAGVVGSAMGFAMGKQGRRVLVVERSLAEPGMQGGVLAYLRLTLV